MLPRLSWCHLAVRELSVMYRGGPGRGWRSLVFTGRRRRVRSLASLLTRPGLVVSLVGRRRGRIFSWPGVRGTVGGGRTGGLAGTIGGTMGPGGGGPATTVALITNKNTNVSETKQNKAVRIENNRTK